MKRLEKGTFSRPKDIDGDRRKLVLKPAALAMLTDCIELRDGLHKALTYAIEQLPRLEPCVLHGQIKIGITSRKTPFAPPSWVTRTGCSSEASTPAGAARSYRPSSSKSPTSSGS